MANSSNFQRKQSTSNILRALNLPLAIFGNIPYAVYEWNESLETRMNFMVKFLTYCTYYVATVVLKSGQSRPSKSLF